MSRIPKATRSSETINSLDLPFTTPVAPSTPNPGIPIHATMPEPPVALEPTAFSSLLMSAIEVHSRESLGFLLGGRGKHFIDGRMVECLSVGSAYPLQSADRRRTNVGFGSLTARRRAEMTVRAVGFDLVGGFHSHTDGSDHLSEEDEEAILGDLDEFYSGHGMREWLEVVVGVKRIKRPRAATKLAKLFKLGKVPEPGFYPWNVQPQVVGDLVADTDLIYRVRMAGYLLTVEDVREVRLCYSRY